jgi:hypothetical protein
MVSAKPGSYIPGYYGVWQYGWLIGASAIGPIAADHAHGAPASVTYAAFYPDSGLVVLLLRQSDESHRRHRRRAGTYRHAIAANA